MKLRFFLLAVMVWQTACTAYEAPTSVKIARSLPAATVQARGETTPVGTLNADAADDPAIWQNTVNPSQSLIVGTDKKAGLYLYSLDGKVLNFINAGSVNNVDIRDKVTFADGRKGVLVVASDRNDIAHAKLALFELDPTGKKLMSLGSVAAGDGEAYGICLSQTADALYGFSVLKDGTIHQIELNLSGRSPSGRIVRTMKLTSQSEGCVVDNGARKIYVAEEDVGLWQFDASPSGNTAPTMVGRADNKSLVQDAEGVALADEGNGKGYIIVSSQGDNAYTVYNRIGGAFVGRFRIAQGQFGATEETDGIELSVGDFGPNYPGGLFVAQDGVNPVGAQNFKLVAWAEIKRALNLPD